MWSKFGCKKFDFNPNDKKWMNMVSGVMNNSVVNFTIFTFLEILQKIAVTGENVTPLVLEMFKILYPSKLEKSIKTLYPNEIPESLKYGESIEISVLFDILIVFFRISNVSMVNLVRLEKKVRELNPNSGFVEAILNLKFTGNFDEFEKMCDEIYTKEIREYTSDDIAILWLTISDCLHKYVQEGGTTDTFLGGKTIFGSYFTDKLQEVKEGKIEKMKHEFNPFSIDALGNPTINIHNKDVQKLLQIFTSEYQDDRNFTITNNLPNMGPMLLKLDPYFKLAYYIAVPTNPELGGDEFNQFAYNNRLNNLILYVRHGHNVPGIEVLRNLIKLLGALLNCYWTHKRYDEPFIRNNGGQAYIDNYNGARRGANLQDETNANITRDLQALYNQLSIYNKFYYYDSGDEGSRAIYGCMSQDRYIWARFQTMVNKKYITTQDTKQINEYAALKTLQFNEITTFYTITKAYSITKFIFSTLIPKRLINLLFDADNSYNLMDEVLSIAAGVLLGPRYLATEVTGETAGEILQEYLKVEAKAPDPFITKYMEDQKFIKEEEKGEKFNVFISNKDFTELQKEFLEEKMKELGKKEKISGGALGPLKFRRTGPVSRQNVHEILRRNTRTKTTIGSGSYIIPIRQDDGDDEEEPETFYGGKTEDDIKLFKFLGKTSELSETPEPEIKIDKEGRAKLFKMIGKTEVPVLDTEVQVSESGVREKIHKILGQNSKTIHDVINSESSPRPERTSREKIAILTGVLAGDVLENNSPAPIRDQVHKFLCYLSSHAGAISRLRIQLFNIFLAFMYIMNKSNELVIEKYQKWSKATGKSSLQDFSKHLRYSKRTNIVSKLFTEKNPE